MKNLFLLTAAFAITLVSCKKEQLSNEVATSNESQSIQTIESVQASENSLMPCEWIITDALESNLPEGVETMAMTDCAAYVFAPWLPTLAENGFDYLGLDKEVLRYTYTNEYSATIGSIRGEIIAFVQDNQGETVAQMAIKVLDDGQVQIDQIGGGSEPAEFTKKWGSCMKVAIDELYNDWEDDPAGTFTCWVTGPLCAIGGGIACGIKSFWD